MSRHAAVIGCGTAGPAAALFLARQGWRVTLFERVAQPRPVGAGLLLQPSGMFVLARLGLLERALACGARIERLHGLNHRGREVLDLRYDRLGPECFGLGIHRGQLFRILFEALAEAPVTLRLAAEVARIEEGPGAAAVLTADGESHGPFDLVICADGAFSGVRRALGHDGAVRPFPWAAVWAVVADHERRFGHVLAQRYRRARQMAGVLPVGLDPAGRPSVTLFWSLRGDDYGRWREAGLAAWRAEVVGLFPEAAPLVEQIQSPDQLTFSRYNDVRLPRWRYGRLLYLGDAAHGTSPQLGQGANLGLWDAMTLADCLAEAPLDAALDLYCRRRRPSVRYYQWASRWLTPAFQADGAVIPWLRDLLLGPLCGAPGPRRYMVETLAGLRGGFVRRLAPAPLTGRARTPAALAGPE